MKIEKKYGYIFFAVLLLVAVFAIYMSFFEEKENYAPQYTNGQIPASAQISAEELRAFLKTWIKYEEESGHKPQMPELSYDTTDGMSQIDADFSEWLVEHGWNVNRFVYIDNRLRVIMTTILRDNAIKEKQRLMRAGAENTDNKAIAETLRRAADSQQQNLNIEKISAAERHFVEPQLEALVKLLQTKP